MQLKPIFLILLCSVKILLASNMVHAEGRVSNDESVDTGEENYGDEGSSMPGNIPISNNIKSNQTVPDEKPELVSYNTAKIIALNKITAQSKELTFKMGESKYFGNIEIKVHKCIKDLNLYAPDNNILITVTEEKPDEEPTQIFQGWMMSSNISISTFEHPVYEIFAKNCLE